MADTTPNLLPCPFCGSPGRLQHSAHGGGEYSSVTCTDARCPAWNTTSLPPQPAAAAIRAWNTRAGTARQEQLP